MTEITLPPYGIFPRFHESIAQDSEMMPDWQRDKTDPEARQRAFLAWRQDMRTILSDTLWPYFNRASKKWTGKANTHAHSTTGLEIDLMVQHFQGVESQLDIKPSLCSTPEFGGTHLEQFRVEDAPSQPAGINLRDYVCSLSEEQFLRARNIINQAYQRKLRSLFWLKREFVRPRPYQCALIFGHDQFKYEVAYSATHSSFYSGHCLEGILFSAAVAEVWGKDEELFDSEARTALMRYAVDFGDRRVFAGVHYPSDNIASWYLAINLIPHVFENPAPIHQFVVDAITHHSAVYKLASSEFVNHSALQSAVHLLENSFQPKTEFA